MRGRDCSITLNRFTGEYNTWDFEDLRWQPYDLSKEVTLQPMNKALADSNKSADNPKRINLFTEKNSAKGYTLSVLQRGSKKNEVFVVPDSDNLNAYLEFNRNIASRLSMSKIKYLPIVIAFKRTMSIEELKEFEKKYAFKLVEFVGRAYGVDNERITYAGYGSISESTSLEQLLQDNDIYLVDVSQHVIKDEVMNKLKSNLPIEFEIQNPFWYIE